MILIDENLKVSGHYSFEKPPDVKIKDDSKLYFQRREEEKLLSKTEQEASADPTLEPIENEQDYSPYINLYDYTLYLWNGGRLLGALLKDHLIVYKLENNKQECLKIITLRGTKVFHNLTY